MEDKGNIYLSPQFKKSGYTALNLSLTSDQSAWEKAVEIFDDRITGRYIHQIDLLSNDVKANGFMIMAANCLLIETLLQFKEAYDQTPRGANATEYCTFLRTEFPNEFDSTAKAQRFYTNIRCGILHSAQTYGKTRLTSDNSYVISLNCKNVLSVSVDGISHLLKSYFATYKNKLLSPTEVTLRTNFLTKMNYVCRQY